MSSVVDFLEKMGSEAQWRYASSDDMEAALADAGIDAAMRAAILAKSADEVQALLGQVKLMITQTPSPTPHEVPEKQPEPGEEDEEGNDETSGSSKLSSHACDSPSLLSPSSP